MERQLMKIRGSKAVHYESGPNMTPLVDVVMVILIFLMLAGSFVGNEHYLQASQPISTGPSKALRGAPGDEPIEVFLDSPMPDRFAAHFGKFRATDSATLSANLRTLRTELNATGSPTSKLRVVIVPRRSVSYRFIVAAYESAMNAEFTNIGFARARN
jgi:biopolymer transport protein ExbD